MRKSSALLTDLRRERWCSARQRRLLRGNLRIRPRFWLGERFAVALGGKGVDFRIVLSLYGLIHETLGDD